MKLSSSLILFTGFGLATTASAQDYSITVLHNNDAESQLLNYDDALPEYGGVALFTTLVNETRSFYEGINHGVVSLTSGDNFLAGPEFAASLDTGSDPLTRTYYDALAVSAIGYDAVILGNHDFDFGPDVLAGFISDAQSTNPTTFLSANLDFSNEANLQNHVTNGLLAPSTIITKPTAAGNRTIGIIGATTENLGFISSPRDVLINDVATAVNAQIAALQSQGVDHIILSSHLQSVEEDRALVAQLNAGVDLMIAGGGDDLLASPGAASPSSINSGAPASIADTGLIPGESAQDSYPVISSETDLGGNAIPIVTTAGNYGYLGRITLNVDGTTGDITVDASSNPQRVASTTADATNGVAPNTSVQASVVDPVQAYVDNLDATVVATSSTTIAQGGSDGVRSREMPVGNVVADAFLVAANNNAASVGVGAPDVALPNGGGIRASLVPNASDEISVLDTFNVSPFGNFVAMIENMSAEDFELLMENAVSRVVDADPLPGFNNIDPERQGDGTGRFAQIAGGTLTYDLSRQAMVLDQDGEVEVEGGRIVSFVLDDGTVIIDNYDAIDGEFLNVVLTSFNAQGGDQYNGAYLNDGDLEDGNYSFTMLGITDQQALEEYLESLSGPIDSMPEYNGTADPRITAIPEPNAAALAALGAALLLIGRRRA